MLTKKQKDFADFLSRQILIEYVEKSRHSNNKELKNYILNEAPYHTVMIAAFNRTVILKEDAQSYDQINAAESKFKRFLSIPLSILASGPVYRTVGTMVGGGAKAIAGTMLASTLMSAGISMGVGILAKIIFMQVRKRIGVCEKNCRTTIDRRDPFYKYKTPICVSTCKIKMYRDMISKLSIEKTKCNQTNNPEKCEHNILGQIIKYQGLMKEEHDRLISKQESYRKAESKKRHPLTLSAKPPQMKNINKMN